MENVLTVMTWKLRLAGHIDNACGAKTGRNKFLIFLLPGNGSTGISSSGICFVIVRFLSSNPASPSDPFSTFVVAVNVVLATEGLVFVFVNYWKCFWSNH
jgi:hypothetical protein